jgi:hypothetical protein
MDTCGVIELHRHRSRETLKRRFPGRAETGFFFQSLFRHAIEGFAARDRLLNQASRA